MNNDFLNFSFLVCNCYCFKRLEFPFAQISLPQTHGGKCWKLSLHNVLFTAWPGYVTLLSKCKYVWKNDNTCSWFEWTSHKRTSYFFANECLYREHNKDKSVAFYNYVPTGAFCEGLLSTIKLPNILWFARVPVSLVISYNQHCFQNGSDCWVRSGRLIPFTWNNILNHPILALMRFWYWAIMQFMPLCR